MVPPPEVSRVWVNTLTGKMASIPINAKISVTIFIALLLLITFLISKPFDVYWHYRNSSHNNAS